jgi:hypothetical protein
MDMGKVLEGTVNLSDRTDKVEPEEEVAGMVEDSQDKELVE